MQAAALSGKAMAEWIAASRGRQPHDLADLALGLSTPLKPVAGEEIGQFPSSQDGGVPQQQQPQQQPQRQGEQRQRQQREAARTGRPVRERGKGAATAPQLLSRPVRRNS